MSLSVWARVGTNGVPTGAAREVLGEAVHALRLAGDVLAEFVAQQAVLRAGWSAGQCGLGHGPVTGVGVVAVRLL